MYKEYDEKNICAGNSLTPEENWPYIRHVNGNWFHFSDQPGLLNACLILASGRVFELPGGPPVTQREADGAFDLWT